MMVSVTQVIPQGTVYVGRGTDVETGDWIVFGGDHRPMAVIAEALQELDEDIVAEVPDWAILRRTGNEEVQ